MRGISFVVSPIRDHAFFKKPQFQGLLGNHFFQFTRLATKIRHFTRRGCSGGIAGKPALPSFQKLLRPFATDALGNAFTTAKFGNGLFATQPIKDNADLFFCQVLLTRCPADVLDRLGRISLTCLRFLSHLRSLRSLR
jgi:hypothetical protein